MGLFHAVFIGPNAYRIPHLLFAFNQEGKDVRQSHKTNEQKTTPYAYSIKHGLVSKLTPIHRSVAKYPIRARHVLTAVQLQEGEVK